MSTFLTLITIAFIGYFIISAVKGLSHTSAHSPSVGEERIRDYVYKPQEDYNKKTGITTRMFVFEIVLHCNAREDEKDRFNSLEINQELFCEEEGKFHSSDINNLYGERVGIVDVFNEHNFSEEKHDEIKMFVNNIQENPYRVFVRAFTYDKEDNK